ncbi:MAG TPA: hypothetical protein VGC42_26150 [Kofleriaceae bacterium]
MQRAWVGLLGSLVCVGCGFEAGATSVAGGDDSGGSDGGGGGGIAKRDVCVKLRDTTYGVDWSGCAAAAPVELLDIQTSTMIDTGAAATTGPTCLVISVAVTVSGTTEHVDVCALAATTIHLRDSATLRAHGARPLVLVANTIVVDGKIDVASRLGERGAGSTNANCEPAMHAQAEGGGAGGSYDVAGGKGGDQGGQANTGGMSGGTASTSYLRGGCDGAPGGDGSNNPPGSGGLGGGVVWLASTILTFGDQSSINASGDGGAGGKMAHNGGSGGGSGGMIILQSMTITKSADAKLYANGGHGGGGDGKQAGQDGTTPDDVSSGGDGGRGNGASNNGNNNGDGGRGFAGSAMPENGDPGSPDDGGAGGGGGGGGGGAIRVASQSDIGIKNISPNPSKWTPAP